jgi:hypothetical protein
MAMSGCAKNSGIRVFADLETRSETAVIALIATDEFAWAQDTVPDLGVYSDYDEWRESREGFEAGLTMAGVDVKMVAVAVAPFLTWCRKTGNAPDERALDTFAATTLSCSGLPKSGALAAVREPAPNLQAPTIRSAQIHSITSHKAIGGRSATSVRHRAAASQAAEALDDFAD